MAAYVAASIADTRKKPVVFVSGNEEALDTVAKITNGMMNRKLQRREFIADAWLRELISTG